jgi:hypothetical protein
LRRECEGRNAFTKALPNRKPSAQPSVVLTLKPQKEKNMDDVNEKRIVIDTVIGEPSGQQLLHCYFKEHGDTYNFHDKDHNVKGRDIKLDEQFRFTLDEDPDVTWSLTILKADGSPDRRKLIGSWNDNKDPSLADGEYQAQAGGSGEEEPTTASACA